VIPLTGKPRQEGEMKTPLSDDTEFLGFLGRLAYKAKGWGYQNIFPPTGTERPDPAQKWTAELLKKWADEALGKYNLNLKLVRKIWDWCRKSKVPIEKAISREKCLDCLVDSDVIVNKNDHNACALYNALIELLPGERTKQQGQQRGKWMGEGALGVMDECLEKKMSVRDTIIQLNERALEILRSIPRRSDSKYVFTGKTPDEPFYDLKKQFEKATSKANLQGVTFHTLRHTAASHLVMAGVDIATVREILRHKSIEMTLRYAHLSPDHKRSAVEALGSALVGKAGNEVKSA
jgi:hypothetical protein